MTGGICAKRRTSILRFPRPLSPRHTHSASSIIRLPTPARRASKARRSTISQIRKLSLIHISENKVYLNGNVVLTQGDTVTKGNRLVYDIPTGQAVVLADDGSGKDSGRVHSILTPKSK